MPLIPSIAISKPAPMHSAPAAMQVEHTDAHLEPYILPQGICVARKQSFELVTNLKSAAAIKLQAFDELPLTEHGWEFAETTLTALGNGRWRMART